LAYELASSGVAVLVIDRAVFPRPKCCGGGLTVKAAKLLDGVVPHVTEHSICGADFVTAGSSVFHGLYDKTVMYTVTREKLDLVLLQRAEKAGADVVQGITVSSLNVNQTWVEAVTDKGTFRSQFAIGADGNRSVVARSLNLESRDGFVGIETEVFVGAEDMARWESLVLTDLGYTSNGYGWVFPKKDHLSIGIGSRIDKARNLRGAYLQFLNSLNLSNYTIAKWSGGLIPMYRGKPRVAKGRVALIGDAAGLADPLTGEGIGNAVLSAHLAAPAIQNALKRGAPDLEAYQRSVEERVAPDIEAARFLARIIFSMPKKILDVARSDLRIWNAGCALVRGETSYSEIKGKVGTIAGLYSILRGK